MDSNGTVIEDQWAADDLVDPGPSSVQACPSNQAGNLLQGSKEPLVVTDPHQECKLNYEKQREAVLLLRSEKMSLDKNITYLEMANRKLGEDLFKSHVVNYNLAKELEKTKTDNCVKDGNLSLLRSQLEQSKGSSVTEFNKLRGQVEVLQKEKEDSTHMLKVANKKLEEENKTLMIEAGKIIQLEAYFSTLKSKFVALQEQHKKASTKDASTLTGGVECE